MITEDVEGEALAIARGRQANKPGWVKKRKQQLTEKAGPERT